MQSQISNLMYRRKTVLTSSCMWFQFIPWFHELTVRWWTGRLEVCHPSWWHVINMFGLWNTWNEETQTQSRMMAPSFVSFCFLIAIKKQKAYQGCQWSEPTTSPRISKWTQKLRKKNVQRKEKGGHQINQAMKIQNHDNTSPSDLIVWGQCLLRQH